MQFKKTISMQLASLVTMLVLVAGTPAPAFVAYAQEAPPAEAPASEPAPEPAPESAPAPETTTQEAAPPSEPSSETTSSPDTTSSETSSDSTSGATGGEGGAGGDGGSGVNGGEGGEGAGGGDADATGGSTDATGGDGGTGGTGGDASTGGTAGDGGTGGTGGDADSDADAPAGEDGNADATGGDGGNGGGGGSGGGGSSDAGAGADGGVGGDADADANGDEVAADATGGDGGDGGAGGDGGTPTNFESNATSTGQTEETGEQGATINTGRSDAFGYLISLFNIAITNSSGNILFLRNPLGDALDFTQRIIDLFSGLVASTCDFLGCDDENAKFRLYTDNEVEISNELVVSSLTGENRAESSEGSADISTGDANAYGGIVNFGNLQIVDSRYLILLMNNEGDLSGDILLPDGEFFKTLSAGATMGRDSALYVTNDAGILNNGTTTALTGENTALSDEGSLISTGDARAKTSVANFANQIGAPICFVVNVAGTWNGDVVQLPEGFTHEQGTFGHLICGAGGGQNRGAGMDGLHASTTNYARILNNAIVEAKTGGNTAEGAGANIQTGDADAFLSILNVVNQTIIGQDWIFAMFNIAGDWDGDLQFGAKPGEPDILGEITQQVIGGGGGGGSSKKRNYYDANIIFTKEAQVISVAPPSEIEYTITVDNRGGKLNKVIVNDTMTGPDGREIGSQRWNLGSVAAGEVVTIKYTISFRQDAKLGYYTNTAVLSGEQQAGIALTSMVAKDVIEILPPGLVLDGPQCEPLLTSYLRPGRTNSPVQVKLLQTFLNDSESEQLKITGIYDAATIAAVNRFQKKYATDILTPWGASSPTSNVYYTTQKKINSLYCKDEAGFELTTSQLLEISKFKAGLSKPGDLLKKNDVGLKKLKPTARGLLLMPPPAIPSIFTPVSDKKDTKPVSMMSLPLSLLSSWLLSAVPQVEAMER